jgi:hypothetical protein
MIRGILLLFLIVLVYSAIRTVFRSAQTAYHREDKRARLKGEEMVLCPECGTYVVRGRAVSRRIGGKDVFLCSDSCARHHEEKSRS